MDKLSEILQDAGIQMQVVVDLTQMSVPLKKEWRDTIERLKELPNVTVVEPPKAKVVMEGVIDCIMHGEGKKITPSRETAAEKIDEFPKDADVEYSKLWVVLDGSDPDNPWWLEIERPMIPACEWKGQDVDIHSGDRIRVTMELL